VEVEGAVAVSNAPEGALRRIRPAPFVWRSGAADCGRCGGTACFHWDNYGLVPHLSILALSIKQTLVVITYDINALYIRKYKGATAKQPGGIMIIAPGGVFLTF
jgi:hypothetical protein